MNEYLIILIPLFFFISVYYSSAWFGWGSSYLAILALFPIEFTSIRILALLCNITVVSGSVYVFYKKNLLKFSKIIPLIIFSIPFAYLWGSLKINQDIFFIILGITLLISSILMLIEKNIKIKNKVNNWIIGWSIWFLSWIVWIWWGIFLSPILYIIRWDKAKVIAGTTASFILVNSIAGLLWQTTVNNINIDYKSIILLIITVLAGWQIGSRLTVSKINSKILKKITAFLILFVSLKILWEYLK